MQTHDMKKQKSKRIPRIENNIYQFLCQPYPKTKPHNNNKIQYRSQKPKVKLDTKVSQSLT